MAAGAGMPVVERRCASCVASCGSCTSARPAAGHRRGAEHTAIVDALEDRDVEKAAEALNEHLRRSD